MLARCTSERQGFREMGYRGSTRHAVAGALLALVACGVDAACPSGDQRAELEARAQAASGDAAVARAWSRA
jgi:hypothetical protein